jgi:hypothetical protein
MFDGSGRNEARVVDQGRGVVNRRHMPQLLLSFDINYFPPVLRSKMNLLLTRTICCCLLRVLR